MEVLLVEITCRMKNIASNKYEALQAKYPKITFFKRITKPYKANSEINKHFGRPPFLTPTLTEYQSIHRVPTPISIRPAPPERPYSITSALNTWTSLAGILIFRFGAKSFMYSFSISPQNLNFPPENAIWECTFLIERKNEGRKLPQKLLNPWVFADRNHLRFLG